MFNSRDRSQVHCGGVDCPALSPEPNEPRERRPVPRMRNAATLANLSGVRRRNSERCGRLRLDQDGGVFSPSPGFLEPIRN